jgi:hypothetical protein
MNGSAPVLPRLLKYWTPWMQAAEKAALAIQSHRLAQPDESSHPLSITLHPKSSCHNPTLDANGCLRLFAGPPGF